MMARPIFPVVAALLLATLVATTAPAAPRHHPHRAAHPAVAPVQAHARPPPAAAAEEKVEEVESVDVTPAGVGDEGQDGLTTKQWLAHLHPAAVHFPVAWSLLWLLAEVAGAFGLGGLAAAARPLAWLTVASFVPAVVSGLLHVDELPQDPESLHPAILHRNIMYAALAAASLLALVGEAWARRGRPAGWRRGAFVVALSAQAAAIAIGAHLGGKLVYGDSYLPFF